MHAPRVVMVCLVSLGALFVVPHGYGQSNSSERRITPRIGHYFLPAISGDTVVWFEARGNRPQGRIPGTDIVGQSLRTGRRFRVTSRPTADVAGGLMISGQTVMWDDCRHCRAVNGLPGYAGDQIFIRNLVTGREFPLPLRAFGHLGLWLLSGVAVWGIQHGSGPAKFYAADSVTGHPRALAIDSAFRKILAGRDHFVVWGDRYDLRAGDLLTGRSYILARHAAGESFLTNPVISGERVIWTRWLVGGSVSIEGTDRASDKRFHVVTIPSNHFNPVYGPDTTIQGHVIVWTQTRNPVSSLHPRFALMESDLTSLRTVRLPGGPGSQAQPAVSGRRLVYVNDESDYGHLSRSLILETQLPTSATAADPIWPMRFEGGD